MQANGLSQAAVVKQALPASAGATAQSYLSRWLRGDTFAREAEYDARLKAWLEAQPHTTTPTPTMPAPAPPPPAWAPPVAWALPPASATWTCLEAQPHTTTCPPPTEHEAIVHRLRRYMQANGLTQKQVAELVGFSGYSMFRLWLLGQGERRKPHARVREREAGYDAKVQTWLQSRQDTTRTTCTPPSPQQPAPPGQPPPVTAQTASGATATAPGHVTVQLVPSAGQAAVESAVENCCSGPSCIGLSSSEPSPSGAGANKRSAGPY